MKIKSIQQISDTEVRVTWGDDSVQVLQGKCAKTLLQMTEMKVGERYDIFATSNNKHYNVVISSVDDEVVRFEDKQEKKEYKIYFDTIYRDCYIITKIKETTTTTPKERVETELEDLSVKCRMLETFVVSERFEDLPNVQQYLLKDILSAMLKSEEAFKAMLDCWLD